MLWVLLLVGARALSIRLWELRIDVSLQLHAHTKTSASCLTVALCRPPSSFYFDRVAVYHPHSSADSGSMQPSREIFGDIAPPLADSWRARHARVPNSFFEQLLDMGFPDWL